MCVWRRKGLAWRLLSRPGPPVQDDLRELPGAPETREVGLGLELVQLELEGG